MFGGCPACGGKPGSGHPQCKTCGGSGDWAITSCPRALITDEIADFIQFADLARDGNFPVSGGMLDQSCSFLDACRFFWAQETKMRDHGQAKS